MADYKKKTVKKKLHTTNEKTQKISMQSQFEENSAKRLPKTNKNSFKVYNSRKQEKRMTGFILVALAILLVSVYFIILIFHPVGVTEYFSSLYKTIGSSGGYDITLNGDNTLTVERQNNHFYVLSESELLCYNNNGNVISKVNHGFSKPVLKTSETRALVYGQGENNVKIYKYDKEAYNLTFDFSILSADICKKGYFAVATYSDSYQSVVKVYNKKAEVVFEWYCADGTVSSLLLNESGNKLIVSSFSVSDGMVNTNIRVLDLTSADPEKSFVFNNDMLYGMYNSPGNTVIAVFEKVFYTLDIKNGTYVNNESDFSYNLVEDSVNRTVLSSALSSNSDKNNVVVLKSKGKVSGKFTFEDSIKDIAVYGSRLFVLSNTKLIVCDENGKLLSQIDIPYEAKRVVPISNEHAAIVSNSNINKITLTEVVS